jgi:hypothetical protein
MPRCREQTHDMHILGGSKSTAQSCRTFEDGVSNIHSEPRTAIIVCQWDQVLPDGLQGLDTLSSIDEQIASCKS